MDIIGGIGDFFGNLFGGIFGGGSDDDTSGAKGGLFARAGSARDSINSGHSGGYDVIEDLLELDA